MTNKIKTPIIDDSYRESIECIIDDLNDLTVYGIRKEISDDLLEERKSYIEGILKDLHNENIVWIREMYNKALFSKVKGDINVRRY